MSCASVDGGGVDGIGSQKSSTSCLYKCLLCKSGNIAEPFFVFFSSSTLDTHNKSPLGSAFTSACYVYPRCFEEKKNVYHVFTKQKKEKKMLYYYFYITGILGP
jgi:hypothetical protein